MIVLYKSISTIAPPLRYVLAVEKSLPNLMPLMKTPHCGIRHVYYYLYYLVLSVIRTLVSPLPICQDLESGKSEFGLPFWEKLKMTQTNKCGIFPSFHSSSHSTFLLPLHFRLAAAVRPSSRNVCLLNIHPSPLSKRGIKYWLAWRLRPCSPPASMTGPSIRSSIVARISGLLPSRTGFA